MQRSFILLCYFPFLSASLPLSFNDSGMASVEPMMNNNKVEYAPVKENNEFQHSHSATDSGYSREKLYVHTDKDTYVTGDTLWFKSYLVDALTQRPSSRSTIEYVELIDKNKHAVKRLALHTAFGMGFGQIAVDTDYASGKYILRAYSNWMQNFGESLFFQKEITISRLKGNWFITASRPQIQRANDSINVRQTFRLKEQAGKPLVLEPVAFFVKDGKGKIIRQGIRHTNGNGEVAVNYVLNKEQATQNISVEVGKNKDDIVARQNLYPEKNIDVQILLESGHLVEGQPNEVGFKAIGSDGLGTNIAGVLRDNTGKEILHFQSIYKGMGVFTFTPEAGKSYKAYIKAENAGNEKNVGNDESDSASGPPLLAFNLPLPEPSGTLLHVDCPNRDCSDSSVTLTIRTTKDLIGKRFFITGQSKGKPIYKANLVVTDSVFSTSIPKSIFPTGVASFQLMSDKGRVINERAFFVNNFDQLRLTISLPQQTYHSHDSIPVTVTARYKNGNPVMGSFSVAVTDDSQVNKDIDKDQTILSYLLLQSDLRGNIETPDYYFRSSGEGKGEALDALMLTQGFVRYDWDTAKFKYRNEPEFEIRGRVTNAVFAGSKNAQIILWGSDNKTVVLKDTLTDDKGYFIFRNFPYFDTSTFVIQAKKKLLGKYGLSIEMQRFHPAEATLEAFNYHYQNIAPDSALENAVQQRNNYQAASKTTDGYLPDVGVSTGKANLVITQDEIRENDDATLFDILKAKIKGFHITLVGGHEPYYGVGDTTATFIVDGEDWLDHANIDYTPDPNAPFNFLTSIAVQTERVLRGFPASDIKKIRIDPSGQSTQGSWCFPVLVTTYAGTGFQQKASAGMGYYHPIPFSYGKLFYSPRYPVADAKDSLPDLRSTIFWSPLVATDDRAGKAQFYFFSADKPGKYTIWLEGMDLNGNIGVEQYKVNIN